MKKHFTLISSIIIAGLINGQNLVPNPSFENYSSCPGGFGMLNESMEDWKAWGYTDELLSCFNVCTGQWGSSVPQNGVGNQEPVSGNGYAGLTTLGVSYPGEQSHIGCRLDTPLQIGQTYFVSYYVNRARFWGDYSTNNQNIGLKFYTDASNPESIPINFSQQSAHVGTVDLPIDTTNWSRVEGWFIADSAYSWIGIGNYFGLPYSGEDIDSIFPEGRTRNYFYIDDVCVSTNPAYCSNVLSVKNNIDDVPKRWEVFPNPSNGVVNFKMPSDFLRYKISITDIYGKVVETNSFLNSGTYRLNAIEFQPGIYIISFENESNQLQQTLKFIIS